MEMVQSNKQVVSASEQTVRARKDPLFRTTVGAEMTVKPEAVCVPAMGAITGQVSENISDTRVFGSSGGGGTSVPVRSVSIGLSRGQYGGINSVWSTNSCGTTGSELAVSGCNRVKICQQSSH